MRPRAIVLAGLVLILISGLGAAQIVVPESGSHRRPVHPPIIPIHPIPRPVPSSYSVRSVDVVANVHDQVAKVRMKQLFENTGSNVLEAKFLFPIPSDAAVSDLTLLYDGKELPGRLLSKEDARRIYEEIVRRQRDPALLEYADHGLFQTSVFPIPPHAARTVEIRYTQLVKKNAGLVDLLLPLGTFKHINKPIETFTVTLKLEASEPIKAVYSPTHTLTFDRPDDRHATARLTLSNVTTSDDLRVFYSLKEGPVGLSLVSYRPNEKEDGYFLLLASPEIQAPAANIAPRTIVIVVDRSGSMSGEKIQQARDAVKFLLHQLKPADTFNVIAYDTEVEAFRPELQRTSSDTIRAALTFADSINAGGGTNIDGALTTALGMLRDNKRPSYILFLTDGMPTVGERNEMRIVAHAKAADHVAARIFNLGIGYDVNSRLLDRLSRELAGQSVYVRPNENIEASVSALAKTIGAPLLTNLEVRFALDRPHSDSDATVSRTYPRKLTDLFAGEQLVWVGRYRQPGKVKVRLTGIINGKKQEFDLAADLKEGSVGDSDNFVARLWATRRIGELIDEIDLHGKNQELVDELVRLSLAHGIMTPYTSFLADDNVRLTDSEGLMGRTSNSLGRLGEHGGQSGFDQRSFKGQLQSASSPVPNVWSATQRWGTAKAAPSGFQLNGGLTSAGTLPEGTSSEKSENLDRVQRIGSKTFYRKNNQWRDADVTVEGEKQVIHVKQFSEEYFGLAAKDRGQFAKYLALDGPVLVSLDGKTYSIDPAE